MGYLARSLRLKNQLLGAYRMQKQMAKMVVPACSVHGREYIGKREVVGFGANGTYDYFDSLAAPYPAIRFREETDEIAKLREKEKGDWSKLSIEEKRKLYRHNFCLTLSEVDPPTGDWKLYVAVFLAHVGLTLYFFGFARKYFFGPLPESMSLEGKQATRDLEIKYKTNPIFGLASKFDYEKGDWK